MNLLIHITYYMLSLRVNYKKLCAVIAIHGFETLGYWLSLNRANLEGKLSDSLWAKEAVMEPSILLAQVNNFHNVS